MKTLRRRYQYRYYGLAGAVAGTVLALASTGAPTIAQTLPNRLQGPVLAEDDRDAQLRRERFRRQAAETAQKQLEQLAEQLRDQLGREVAARQAAEATVAEFLSRAALDDQIDQERSRLRNEKIKILEERRALLEREVDALSNRLIKERALRKQLESRAPTSSSAASNTSRAAAATSKLQAMVAELERKLKAAEWARKLAEEQLKVIVDRGSAPAKRP